MKKPSQKLTAKSAALLAVRVVAAVFASPFTYVFGFALAGASSIVSGVYEIAGYGPAAIVAGVFLLLASAFITKGLMPNG